MNEPFLNQTEAWAFVKTIAAPKTKLLTELALARALSFLVTDPAFASSFARSPFDALLYARCLEAFFSNESLLQKVMNEEVTSVHDLD